MLDTLHNFIWRVNKFLYLRNMGKDRKLYQRKIIAQKIEELKTLDTELFLSFIIRAEEFLVWAKENEEVPSVWSRLFIAIYIIYLKLDLLLCKLVYRYFHDEYEKVEFRNAIADLMYECKLEQYKGLEMSKVKLSHLQALYKWLCENQ